MVSSTMVMLFYNRELSFFCMGRQKKRGGGRASAPILCALDISIFEKSYSSKIFIQLTTCIFTNITARRQGDKRTLSRERSLLPRYVELNFSSLLESERLFFE